jgi:hypothetical protein
MSYQELFSLQIIEQLNQKDWQAIGIYEEFQQAILGILIREPMSIVELEKVIYAQVSQSLHHLLSLVLGELIKKMLEVDMIYQINSSQKYQLSRATKDKLAIHLNLKPQETINLTTNQVTTSRLSSIAGEVVQASKSTKPTSKSIPIIKIQNAQSTTDSSKPKVTGLRLNKVITHLTEFAYPLDVLAQRTRMNDVELLQLLEVMKTNGFIKQKDLNYELDWRGFDFYRMDDSERLNLLKEVAQRINAEK